MEIDGKLMEGEVVEREKARQTYEGIVRSMKDPALLEWMPGGMFQCRIFPIEAGSDKRIVIAYTQALSIFDGRGRYVYPLSGESARELGIRRFEFTATIRAGSKIVSAASTSHAAPTIRLDDKTMRTTFAHSDFRPRADFVLAFETEARGEMQVSAHRPDGAGPGYFAAFITPRTDPEEDVRRDRKLHFLIDASGSVARPELEAARIIVRRMVESLGPADRFKIGCHNLFTGTMPDYVAPDEAGKRAADRYLSEIAPAGACDVATALETVLADVPDNGEVVYVGEGTPTWGEKDPAKIVARIREAIGTRRISIRTVAVGSDADKGLLETVAREFNGGAHAVSPSDDVHERAGEIARTLGRSALTDVKVEFRGAVTDAAPAKPGPIHFGERLLVTGRYGAGPVTLVLTGRVHDRTIQKEFALTLPEREAGNLHVKRLWAQRRLADLVAQGGEKRAEAVKLSVEHQVMTPYTSFLVLENEKAYEQHQIDRTKKDLDQTKDPRLVDAKRLFQECLADFAARRFDLVIEKCDRILAIDPKHALAAEVKEETQKLRHREDPNGPERLLKKWSEGESHSSQEWDQLHRKLVGKSRVDEQEKGAQAEEHYRLALRYYDSGDFEKAEAECAKALSLNPNYGASHALMLEVQFALGKGKVKPQSLEFETIIQMATARQQQVIFEVRDAMDKGIRDYNLGKYDDAERQFRTIIEYAKWLPSGTGIDVQRKQASEMLEKNRVARGAPGQSMPAQREAAGTIKPGPGEGTLGKLIDDEIDPAFSTLPGQQFSAFIEPEEQTSNGGLAFTVGEGMRTGTSIFATRFLGGSGLAGASFTLEEPWGSEVGPGFVTRESARLETYDLRAQAYHTLLRFDPVSRSRIGGTGSSFEGDLDQAGVDSLTDNLNALTRRLDDSLQRMKVLEARIQEERKSPLAAIREQLSATQDLQYQRQETERLSNQLASLEENYQQLARDRQRIQETIANLNAAGIQCDVVAPRKALSGKVTAVAKELDLVVLSIGRDAGVNEGDEFTITRANAFICKIVVDRVDRPWAAGRVALKGKAEPVIGDDASNNVLSTPGQIVRMPIKVAWTSGNEVHLSGADRYGIGPGSEILLSRNDKYVAVVRVYEVNGTTAKASVAPGLRGIPIEVGDPGIVIRSQVELWSVLPIHIRQDIVSERDLAAARFKLRALRGVAP
jgi:tetratricopeptide (TPR) repeat protein